MKAYLGLPLALVIAGGAATAQAQNLNFAYHAYELETSAGRQVVLNRLDGSVGRYCGSEDKRGLWTRQPVSDCRAGLLDEMVGKIGDARLVALHQGRVRLAATK